MMTDKSKIYFPILIILLSIICVASIYFFRPIIDSDGISYVESVEVLQGSSIQEGFVPNRVLNSFLGLRSLILFSKIFGSIEIGWLIMNVLLFFSLSTLFYKLILNVWKSHEIALISTLFLSSNYAMITFGLDYWMDISGWFFYILSLYFGLKYARGNDRAIYLSSLAVGIGILFKEYAFLGIIPIAVLIIYKNWPNLIGILNKGIATAFIALMPISIVYLYVFQRFNYSYVDWLSNNSEHYVYSSRIVEYIKSFGSLYNVLAIAVIFGLYCFILNRKTSDDAQVFMVSAILSVLPVFIWPAITQRILFVTVPVGILIASHLFKRFERQWYWFLPVIGIYVAMNFMMSSFILPNFNLPF